MPRDDAEGSTRRRPTALLIVAGALLLARAATGVYEGTRPAPELLVRWVDVDAAEARAAAEKKPILYDFSAAWCQPCKRMEHDVFADPAGADFINHAFVPVRITDEDDRMLARALRATYDATSIPLLVVAHAGKEGKRQNGYRNKRATLGFLRRAAIDP